MRDDDDDDIHLELSACYRPFYIFLFIALLNMQSCAGFGTKVQVVLWDNSSP